MIFLYNAIANKNGSYTVGCLAKNKDNTKIKFETFDNLEENTIKEKFNWYMTEGSEHYWVENNIPKEYDKYIDILKKELEDQVIKENNEDIPGYVYITNKDIMSKVKSEMDTEDKDILTLNLLVTKSIILMRISNFFSQNPTALFEFPLYEEFIEKNQLTDFSVEDFLVELEKSTMIGFQ
jgi:hypothetical protein